MTGRCKRDVVKRNNEAGSRKQEVAKRNGDSIGSRKQHREAKRNNEQTGSRKHEAKRNSDSIGSRKQQGAKHNSTKTGPGADPRMSISHIASSNKRWYEQGKEAPVSTPEARNNISFRQAPRKYKGVSIIDRPSKTKNRRELMSAHRDEEGEQSTWRTHGVSGDAKRVHFKDGASVDASEGMNEYPKASDLTINLWLRELGGSWAAAANREKRQEKGTSKDHPPALVEPTDKKTTKIRHHKAKVLEVTMMVDGREEKIVENRETTDQEAKWDFKGKSIDEILELLNKLKSDPTIPMPKIETDPATIEEFLQYNKDNPTLLNHQEGEGLVDMEQHLDEADLVYLREKCTDCHRDIMPKGFPDDLWPFVCDTEKIQVLERWKGYNLEKVGEKIEKLRNEIRISKERPYAYPYYLAQAIANLDRYEVKESDGVTPLIHERFTHSIETYTNTRAVREKPQRFSETQNAFLRAKLNILESQGKVQQRNGLQDGDWLHRLVLVEYPTRMEKFRAKYGNDVQKALNGPANEYEVSQLFRLTIDCREVNKVTIIEPYPMPDNNMGKENIIGSRYMSTSDAADAFYAVPIR